MLFQETTRNEFYNVESASAMKIYVGERWAEWRTIS